MMQHRWWPTWSLIHFLFLAWQRSIKLVNPPNSLENKDFFFSSFCFLCVGIYIYITSRTRYTFLFYHGDKSSSCSTVRRSGLEMLSWVSIMACLVIWWEWNEYSKMNVYFYVWLLKNILIECLIIYLKECLFHRD